MIFRIVENPDTVHKTGFEEVWADSKAGSATIPQMNFWPEHNFPVCPTTAQDSDHKAANRVGVLHCSAGANRVNLCSKKKFQLAQCFGGRFAREFPNVMHHVHLIVVPEFMCYIGPRFR